MAEERATFVGFFFRTSCQVKANRLQLQEEAETNVESSLSITKENDEWTHTYHSGAYTQQYCFKIGETFGSSIFIKRKSDEK